MRRLARIVFSGSGETRTSPPIFSLVEFGDDERLEVRPGAPTSHIGICKKTCHEVQCSSRKGIWLISNLRWAFM